MFTFLGYYTKIRYYYVKYDSNINQIANGFSTFSIWRLNIISSILTSESVVCCYSSITKLRQYRISDSLHVGCPIVLDLTTDFVVSATVFCVHAGEHFINIYTAPTSCKYCLNALFTCRCLSKMYYKLHLFNLYMCITLYLLIDSDVVNILWTVKIS